VTYAEIFHGGGGVHSVSHGDDLYMVCAVCDITIWRSRQNKRISSDRV